MSERRHAIPSAGVAVARSMLEEATRATVSSWPRACALLARQEFERALTRFWQSREPGMAHVTMRAQLLCLRAYVNEPALAGDAAWIYGALSRATHHHPYELDPTREELATLVDQTEALVARLAALSG